ncbi:MAG: hypothetical protein IPM14_08910 [bacterium]|nr:hypothetical protein [bacterium]
MRPNFSCKINLSLFFLLLITLFIAYSLQLNATIRYVSKTGLSIPPYTSWETAADSIQKCINICVFGDTIYVANGVYEEQVVMIPGLSLIGAGMDSCVIYLSATGIPAVQIKDTCLLKGFKILLPNTLNTWGIQANQNGYGSCITSNRIVNASLGIYIRYSNPLVYNNLLENIKTRGVWIFNSGSNIRRNFIYTDQNSQVVDGVYIEAFNSNYRSIIDSNYIETNSYGIYKNIGARPTITNNFIFFGPPYGGVGMRFSTSDSAYVYNNLIFTKSGIESVTGLRNYGAQYLKIKNNHIVGIYEDYIILMGPDDQAKNNGVTDAQGWISAFSGGNFKYQYNNVWNSSVIYSGITPDTTNLSVNPMIVNDDTTQGDLDFHLQKFSPLIDAGDPNILDKDSTRSDIGLYGGPYGESYFYVDLPPRSPVNLTANVDSLIKLNWNKTTESDFSYYNVYRDTTFDFTLDSTKLIASITDTFYYHTFPSNVETLYYKLTAVDNQGNESNPSEQVSVKLVPVKNGWVPVNNYILYQNYPNPFNPSTKIGYKLKERGNVKLYVYDIKGELVNVLVNEVQEAGYYEVEFSASNNQHSESSIKNLASGVYIYQIFVKGENNIPVFSDIKKMIYIK